MMIDAIIRTRSPELAACCLGSLPPGYTRAGVVVDLEELPDGTHDTLAKADCVLQSWGKGAVTATNYGLTWALDHHDSHWIAILDDDVLAPIDCRTLWHDWLVEAAAHQDTGACGATSDNISGPQCVIRAPATYTRDFSGGSKTNPEVPAFVSCCVLLRKEAVRQVGLWDERFNPGQFEDTDYAVMLRRAGWKIRVARSVFFFHKCHATFGDGFGELIRANYPKFIEKHGLGLLWDMGLVPDSMVAAALKHRQGGGDAVPAAK